MFRDRCVERSSEGGLHRRNKLMRRAVDCQTRMCNAVYRIGARRDRPRPLSLGSVSWNPWPRANELSWRQYCFPGKGYVTKGEARKRGSASAAPVLTVVGTPEGLRSRCRPVNYGWVTRYAIIDGWDVRLDDGAEEGRRKDDGFALTAAPAGAR